MSCDVVQLNMKGYVVPMICSPLQKQAVKFAVDSYSHLKALQLADDGDLVSTPEIDILVGADFHWHIVTGNVIRGENGLVAMETKFGCVLSGPGHDSGNNDDTSTFLHCNSLIEGGNCC